jgi:hypothetical protein
MIKISQILDKVFPKLRGLEEDPMLTIIRSDSTISSNPFSGKVNAEYSVTFEVPCLYSEQPEIVRAGSNITTEQQMYLYIKQKDLVACEPVDTTREAGIISKKDRFVFKSRRFIPVEIQELFGLWKIKVAKE